MKSNSEFAGTLPTHGQTHCRSMDGAVSWPAPAHGRSMDGAATEVTRERTRPNTALACRFQRVHHALVGDNALSSSFKFFFPQIMLHRHPLFLPGVGISRIILSFSASFSAALPLPCSSSYRADFRGRDLARILLS